MHGIFTYIWDIYGVHVATYSNHGAYGVGQLELSQHLQWLCMISEWYSHQNPHTPAIAFLIHRLSKTMTILVNSACFIALWYLMDWNCWNVGNFHPIYTCVLAKRTKSGWHMWPVLSTFQVSKGCQLDATRFNSFRCLGHSEKAADEGSAKDKDTVICPWRRWLDETETNHSTYKYIYGVS